MASHYSRGNHVGVDLLHNERDKFGGAGTAPDDVLPGLIDRRRVAEGHGKTQLAPRALGLAKYDRSHGGGEIVQDVGHPDHSKDHDLRGDLGGVFVGHDQFPRRRATESTSPPAVKKTSAADPP